MRVSTLFAAAYILPAALAYPWLQPGSSGAEQMAGIRRGLEAMSQDKELVKQIRELHAEQKREEAAWLKAGKRDIVGALVNGTIGAAYHAWALGGGAYWLS